ncbi:MAG TPA: APC family permease [Candidatus Binatia bacterium]|jgi:amino acid transporter
MKSTLKRALWGKPKDPLDPHVFHQISLVAFLAWVGLGADGLSSSAYGPEEAYLALGQHLLLALPLAILMAVTVFVISASYSQIIELFPTGGGGYLVATKLLGPKVGLVSGCALIVDYMLTITISVASGADAIFSFLPPEMHPIKLGVEFVFIFLLIYLNLRGTKESVMFLLPIFLAFVALHIAAIGLGILPNAQALPDLSAHTYRETVGDIQGLGLWTTIFIILHAYSLGGGTYTGIEAVSNGLQVLREPRVQTGKKTMRYMAVSLAFTASGLLLCYLLNHVAHQPGKTLNASLLEKIYSGYFTGDSAIYTMVVITLLSEAALLLVAAQTGFIDGPRVLSNMAIDSWVPHRFSHLSDHLVTRYGIWFMGIASLAFLTYTAGDVRLLVVMYSINVFLTFTLSQLGMCRHWFEVRSHHPGWLRKFLLNGVGLLLTAIILVVTLVFKFAEGGWVTAAVTSLFVLICYIVRAHYESVRGALKRLDETLINIPFRPDLNPVPERNPNAPTAVVVVRAFDGIGIHTLLNIQRLFPNHFRNVIFISVGVIDSSQFKGSAEIHNLRKRTEENLQSYVEFANCLGWYAEFRYSLGIDLMAELEKLCKEVSYEFPRAVFFAGKLIFERETFLTNVLHNQTPYTLQRKLQFEGLQTFILPIRVYTPQAAAA